MKLEDLLPKQAEMPLLHPITQAPLPIVFFLRGHDSVAFRERARALLKAKQGKKNSEADLVELENDNQELIASCIVGWNTEADEAFGEYTPQNALKMLKNPELAFIREQIDVFIADRSNFFRGAAQAA